ncbi:two-component system, chemotaxis family, response regulator CheY [Paenibacillus sp. UNCCL117]|uniref:response regulator n=1 Tax=unclassified Paenibacillus TaxID=185978 RepID=UPI00087FBE0E|nr:MULTISPECIES: response regulator [unclassified Paenibacillus]SDD14331.1 two-component system, chemotaxis family, response regulator CheY [Paenibacillus sp. cl123]SFW34203.1 two-component system, chemotaxis family, response regulator CheY [Paenibacillus sp. UNCCL117]
MSRILIVDDTAFIRAILRMLLQELGHEVIGEASNGQEAISLYKRLRPDLVTMDITMPELDGVAAVRGIRQQDTRAKIVMCSALGQKEQVIRALKAGAGDFIVKPIQADRMKQSIDRLLGIQTQT